MDSAAQNRSFSIKFWPPSQSTRLLLVERMTKNLTTPWTFSRKHGLLSKEEAEQDAKQIESVAFASASQHYEKEPDGDGSSAVKVYAKESSKLMLEVLKRGPIAKDVGEVISEQTNGSEETFFDISGDRRAFIEAEEAEELLKPLARPGNKYSKICFSNRSFGLDMARVAEPILTAVKHSKTYVIILFVHNVFNIINCRCAMQVKSILRGGHL